MLVGLVHLERYANSTNKLKYSAQSNNLKTFRTQQTRLNQADRDAANFFSATLPSGPSAFDLSGLHASLPIVAAETPPSFQPSKPQSQVPAASWVTDFTRYQRQGGPEIVSGVRPQSVGTDFNSVSQGQFSDFVDASCPMTGRCH